MSKEAAAAILTQVYFQNTPGVSRVIKAKTDSESFPYIGPAPTLDAVQTEILHIYDLFYSQLSKV